MNLYYSFGFYLVDIDSGALLFQCFRGINFFKAIFSFHCCLIDGAAPLNTTGK